MKIICRSKIIPVSRITIHYDGHFVCIIIIIIIIIRGEVGRATDYGVDDIRVGVQIPVG
jgi:hypothetical protein